MRLRHLVAGGSAFLCYRVVQALAHRVELRGRQERSEVDVAGFVECPAFAGGEQSVVRVFDAKLAASGLDPAARQAVRGTAQVPV